ncbi:MAG: carboxyltransferase domain-containing protein [Polyangiaceae bacterium]|nr:carboxyltransferase domain-containing protein [Polyangiaceae bacterium]
MRARGRPHGRRGRARRASGAGGRRAPARARWRRFGRRGWGVISRRGEGRVGRLGAGWLAEPPGLPPPGVERVRALAALAARLQGGATGATIDVVIGGRSVWVEGAAEAAIVAALESGAPAGPSAPPRHHELEVVYDGPDLQALAELAGAPAEEIARLHAEPTYVAWVAGFLPGFAYLAEVDPRIARPRLATPRRRVPAGSVGVAGRLTGVYPTASPGGWNLVGRALDPGLFAADRAPPRRIAVLDTVRFVPRPMPPPGQGAPGGGDRPRHGEGAAHEAAALAVVRAGPLVTVQDRGRPGRRGDGVPLGGALVPAGLARANAAVDNDPRAAALELFDSELELALLRDAVASVEGEPPRRLRAGERLHVGRARGAVRYVAFAGGVSVPVVLGARSTSPAVGIGGVEGRPLRAGDRLALGHSAAALGGGPPAAPRASRVVGDYGDPAAPGEPEDPSSPLRLALELGPADARLPPRALAALLEHEFALTSARDRTGFRLAGPAVPREGSDLALPDPVVPGAVQLPGDGQPIVLGPDSAVTGGYPVAGVLTAPALAALALARPGRRLRFMAR